jgi:hypothetical protein
LTELALEAAGSLGEQTMPGPTGIVAGDQPLQIERPGKPKATLKDGGQVLLPAETVATISNTGDSPTTMLVVSLSPIIEATPTPEPTVEPTAEPEPTEESAADSANLASFLPSNEEVADIGFSSMALYPVNSVDDTGFFGLESMGLDDNWMTGILSIYEPGPDLDGVLQGQVSLDQFDDPTVPATIFGLSADSVEDFYTVIEPPQDSGADEVLAYFAENATPEGFSAVFIMGYYGSVFTTVIVFMRPGADAAVAENAARELWLAVDVAP